MREVSGDLWTYADLGHWIGITTNGTLRRDGRLVMGRGVAAAAARRYPTLPSELGQVVARSGSHVWPMVKYRLFSFPVKVHYFERADPRLITWSAKELVDKVTGVNAFFRPCITAVYLVRPGCGNGRLSWDAVKPLISPILDDRFVIVEREP